MRLLLLCLLILSQACSEAYADRLRRSTGSRSRGSATKAVGGAAPEVNEITGAYDDWAILWTGEADSLGTTWIDKGSQSIDIEGEAGVTETGVAATTGVTLPVSLTDRLVTCDADDSWDLTQMTTMNDDLHSRFVVKWDALVANRFVARYVFGANVVLQIRAVSTTNLGIRAQFTNTAAEFSFNVSAWAGKLLWCDWYVDVDDGTTDCTGLPCSHHYVYCNGTQYVNTQTAISPVTQLLGAGEWTFCSFTGNTLFWDNDVLLYGLRQGTIDEATHDAHVAAHGFDTQ